MELTKYDVHICRILFNKDTHDMAVALYGDRAREIYKFICNAVFEGHDFFQDTEWSFFKILIDERTCNFFFENNLYSLVSWNFMYSLSNSPIADKILNSRQFDSYTNRINGDIVREILTNSPVLDKIWDDGKISNYLHKLSGRQIRKILIESPIAEKIWHSGKLDPYFGKLKDYDIYHILDEPPIADKIIQSGKLNLK